MIRTISTCLLGATLFVCSAGSQTQNHAKAGFQPAELSTASGIEYPVNTVAFGAVVFELTVDESGAVEKVEPIREIPSLTEPALHALKGWRFKPAMMNGDAVQSLVTVAVMFNPPQNPPADPLGARSGGGAGGRPRVQPTPPEVTSAVFAIYPMTTAVKKGTVVLEAEIGENGEVSEVKPTRDQPPLTGPAIDALKKWQFRPADFNGKPVASNIFVAFVMESPLTHSY